MTDTQIKDYLKKYRIASEEQLAKHIEELKRNTKPNNEIIFPLVDLLLNEKSVLLSFFRENSKERGETANPFFLDEAVISYQSFENGKFKDNTVTYTSTRHKAREEGRYHPYPKKDDVITNNSRGEKETMEYLQGVKETEGKVNYGELDFDYVDSMALRMSKNLEKYPPKNWQKKMDIEELAKSAIRHARKILQQIENDEETLEEHAIALGCNGMMINYQLKVK